MSVEIDFGTSNPSAKRIVGHIILGVAAVTGMASVSSEALAQAACANNTTFAQNSISTQMGPVFSGSSSAAAAIISSIEASNSIFLTQSTAFVSAPPNPKPDSQGGGVWVRGVGGEVEYKGDSTVTTSGAIVPNGTTNCPTTFRQSFGGFQVGQDVARLNVLGWNLHVGQTAGYIETSGHAVDSITPFTTSTQIPFVGAYAAATNGGFFVDGLVRWNWFENSLTSNGTSGLNLNDQKLDAHGVSVSGSAGYHWDVPNSTWFIEPSVGAIWSHTSVDPLNITAGSVAQGNIANGSLQINAIDSFVGRAGARFGTTMQSGNLIYQPFVAVSVWHEFGNDITANFATADGTGTGLITVPTIGTYGQYSLGVNGQIANTGWLGYARVDYRAGDHLQGWTATGGIRYQFTPLGAAPAPGLYKAPVKAPVAEFAPIWTGLYIGGFAGADYGHAKMGFPDAGFSAGPQIAGALAGGTLGYNYQIGSWVLGVEGDAGWTNARGSVACAGPVNVNQPTLFATDCADKADFIATAAARLGYAWGRALYYVKAGGAWTHETFTATCTQPPGSPIPCLNPAGNNLTQISVADDRAGWTVGYGVEFALTQNWSAKGEVNYIDFGNKNLTAADGTVFNAGMRITEGKIGVNYRF
jgi:outer membrane autotransporter protein